ncbi:chemotaxis protein CheB [Mucilaginibacter litoreus]|uniref:protein-glutamate methylesterase n=1 Tax=Mucilaginibacter litoreus TaxID=1048221 RepID=A0ABW3AT41_9SPHI
MTHNYTFDVVGIGLSAGGLTPLLEIVTKLPADFKGALVILSHLPINNNSNLDQILAKKTDLKVIPVSTIEYVECGRIYVLSVGKEMVLKDGFLHVRERNPDDKINKTIDVFFESLAADAKERSLGVILSGAGHDGIKGAKNIEDQNGLIIVQDPETAAFPLMPSGLIANDHPDYILSPDDIAKKIISWLQRS